MQAPNLVLYSAAQHSHLIPSFVSIHVDCTLENITTLADFRPPFTEEKRVRMHEFWRDRLQRTNPGQTDEVIMALLDDNLAGFVQLHMPKTESGPFRGYVQKLFVSPNYRRRGVAKAVMSKLEEIALEKGRWNLSLSTAEPSPARNIYPKWGWIEYGILPNWILNTETNELMNEVCFYKTLKAINDKR